MSDRRRYELVFLVCMLTAGPVMAGATLCSIKAVVVPAVALGVLAIALWAAAGLAMARARRS